MQPSSSPGSGGCSPLPTEIPPFSLGWCVGLATPVLQPHAGWGADLLQFSMITVVCDNALGHVPCSKSSHPSGSRQQFSKPDLPWLIHDKVELRLEKGIPEPESTGCTVTTQSFRTDVLFVFGRYSALKCFFFDKLTQFYNYFLRRSFAKFLFCYLRSSALLKAS